MDWIKKEKISLVNWPLMGWIFRGVGVSGSGSKNFGPCYPYVTVLIVVFV